MKCKLLINKGEVKIISLDNGSSAMFNDVSIAIRFLECLYKTECNIRVVEIESNLDDSEKELKSLIDIFYGHSEMIEKYVKIKTSSIRCNSGLSCILNMLHE